MGRPRRVKGYDVSGKAPKHKSSKAFHHCKPVSGPVFLNSFFQIDHFLNSIFTVALRATLTFFEFSTPVLEFSGIFIFRVSYFLKSFQKIKKKRIYLFFQKKYANLRFSDFLIDQCPKIFRLKKHCSGPQQSPQCRCRDFVILRSLTNRSNAKEPIFIFRFDYSFSGIAYRILISISSWRDHRSFLVFFLCSCA